MTSEFTSRGHWQDWVRAMPACVSLWRLGLRKAAQRRPSETMAQDSNKNADFPYNPDLARRVTPAAIKVPLLRRSAQPIQLIVHDSKQVSLSMPTRAGRTPRNEANHTLPRCTPPEGDVDVQQSPTSNCGALPSAIGNVVHSYTPLEQWRMPIPDSQPLTMPRSTKSLDKEEYNVHVVPVEEAVIQDAVFGDISDKGPNYRNVSCLAPET